MRRAACWMSALLLVGCAKRQAVSPAAEPSSAEVAPVAVNARAVSESLEQCEGLRKRASPAEEERAFGDLLAVRFTEAHGGLFVGSDEASAYVATVGRNLGAHSRRPGLAFRFGIVEGDAPKVFASPGGWVLVSRGALRKVENEAALAGALGNGVVRAASAEVAAYLGKGLSSLCRHSMTMGVVEGTQAFREMNADFEKRAPRPHGLDEVQETQRQLGELVRKIAVHPERAIDFDDPANRALREVLVQLTLPELEADEGGDVARETDQRTADLLRTVGYDPRAYAELLGHFGTDGNVRSELLTAWMKASFARDDGYAVGFAAFKKLARPKLSPALDAARAPGAKVPTRTE